MSVLPSYRNQLICCTNQLTGFYMKATLTFNSLRLITASNIDVLSDHFSDFLVNIFEFFRTSL